MLPYAVPWMERCHDHALRFCRFNPGTCHTGVPEGKVAGFLCWQSARNGTAAYGTRAPSFFYRAVADPDTGIMRAVRFDPPVNVPQEPVEAPFVALEASPEWDALTDSLERLQRISRFDEVVRKQLIS